MSKIHAELIDRQHAIAEGTAESVNLPKFPSYTICNLRGGIGKTSLVFNLSYLTDDILSVDTCPQCNLTWFFDNNYTGNGNATTINDLIIPYFVPGYGKASHVAKKISATNNCFEGKNAFFIPSDMRLYSLPSQISIALVQASLSPQNAQQSIMDTMLFSLKKEIDREMQETKTTKCLIDTSPFFSGATHLACHASDALIVPVRTDQQSINSLELLLYTLTNPASEFKKFAPSNNHIPKIQLIILTHCGWSTVSGAKNWPNQQTKIYVEKVLDIISRYITMFTTDNPDNHLLLLDDFLGAGRMSSAKAKPIELLQVGETMVIHRIRTTVNASVEKIKNQLHYICDCIW